MDLVVVLAFIALILAVSILWANAIDREERRRQPHDVTSSLPVAYLRRRP